MNMPNRASRHHFIRASRCSFVSESLLVWGAAPAAGAAPQTNSDSETKEQRDARMKWWREARFGMFIHWGVYSVPAGVWNGQEVKRSGAEWIMNRGRIPAADYQKL